MEKAGTGERFLTITPSTHQNYRELVRGLTRAAWHEFMLHEQVAGQLWHELLLRFPEYQLALLDIENERVAAMANSFPLRWDEPFNNLPESGWDWAFAKAVQDHKQDLSPNIHCAIQVVIHPDYQGQGLSTQAIHIVRTLTHIKGFQNLVIPVRPSEKSKYPLTSMDDYITWKNNKSLPFDAWLRVHVQAGGEIVKVCHESKVIRGTRAEWEEWTGLKFPQSGLYIIPGALNPVEISIERGEGVYIEPNVWLVHSVA